MNFNRAKAPTARDVIAQGNALGSESVSWWSAEGAEFVVSTLRPLLTCLAGLISRLQRSMRNKITSWAVGPGYYISRRWRFRPITAVLIASLLTGSTAMG